MKTSSAARLDETDTPVLPEATATPLPQPSPKSVEPDEDDADEPVERPVRTLPAKAEKFGEGDYVVYPTHGVGKVERIVQEEIAGHKLELIHITFEENRMTLRVACRQGAQRRPAQARHPQALRRCADGAEGPGADKADHVVAPGPGI